MDFMNRLISTCISTCIVFSVFIAADVAAKPIELVGPNNKVAGKNKTATYGPVKTTDTLWRIAFNHRPDPKLTVDQVLIAIFMANPQAFKNNDIHSIISGSTLTIPSQSDIESITDAAAKLRIANNDQLKTNSRPAARTVSPTTESKPPATTNTQTQTQQPKPTVVVPEPVDKKPEFFDEKGPEQSDTDDQSANVTPVQQENPGLSEQLALAMTDMQLLIKENQALKEQIKALDDKLAEMQTQEALDLQAHEELAELKDELAEIQLAKDMEQDSLLNNGWVIGTIFSLLSTGIMAGVFFWLVRRHKPAPEEPTEAKTAADDNAVPDLETEDDLLEVDADDDLLISDEDDDLLEISDIDDLPDLDDDLLSDGDEDDELLVPSDLDEIQLDDSSELPESEEEVTQEEAPKGDEGILAQDDLEALLAQADELEEEEAQGDPDLSDEIVSTDDIDALLAQADELEVDDADELTSDDDIDALLDEANDAVSDDDIDALLDEANDAVAADDIDALLDEANAPVDADDIDALLDEVNAPVEADDIDALLDEVNAPVEADDIDALLDEANA
ncbi:MAG: FimV/HubP family polar landmark protein, partial [Psychrobium sp.]